jgi:hypothetical protein
MPNRDGTGPRGDGRPGRGLGPCGRSGVSFWGVRSNEASGLVVRGISLFAEIIRAMIASKNNNKRR